MSNATCKHDPDCTGFPELCPSCKFGVIPKMEFPDVEEIKEKITPNETK